MYGHCNSVGVVRHDVKSCVLLEGLWLNSPESIMTGESSSVLEFFFNVNWKISLISGPV